MTQSSVAWNPAEMLDEAELNFGAGTGRYAFPAPEIARPAASSAAPLFVNMRLQDDGALDLRISDFRIEPDAGNKVKSCAISVRPATQEAPTQPADTRELTVATIGEVHQDPAGLALVIRLRWPSWLDLETLHRPRASSLPKWRLKRVINYIERNLTEPISLQELANTTGLSATYFAAQFRATTGFRPREYVLRRRIHHAQRMLCDSQMSIVEIALSFGFQTQAHFTTVFKRFVGETPCRWRHRHIDA